MIPETAMEQRRRYVNVDERNYTRAAHNHRWRHIILPHHQTNVDKSVRISTC